MTSLTRSPLHSTLVEVLLDLQREVFNEYPKDQSFDNRFRDFDIKTYKM